MKKTMMILALSAGVMFAGCGTKPSEEAQTETATETPAEQSAAINTTHAYICPMNCEGSASMEAGNCVKCGMALVENPDYVPAEGSATSTSEEAHDHDEHEGHNH